MMLQINRRFLNVFVPILGGIIFPQLKILVFLYILHTGHRYMDTAYYHVNLVPEKLRLLFTYFCHNYFGWYFGIAFGLQLGNNLQWVSLPLIFYNLITYQILLLSFWKTNPMGGIVSVSILQYFDGTPLIYALIDNVVAVYHSPFVFVPEKLAFYGLCVVFEMFRKK